MVPSIAPLLWFDVKLIIKKSFVFWICPPNAFFHACQTVKPEKSILRSNFDFPKILSKSFWVCRMVKKHLLGSGEWFRIDLDTLERIRSIFGQKIFRCLKSHFQAIFGLPESPKKIHTFSKLIIFNCFKPWDPSHRLPRVQNTSPNALVDP